MTFCGLHRSSPLRAHSEVKNSRSNGFRFQLGLVGDADIVRPHLDEAKEIYWVICIIVASIGSLDLRGFFFFRIACNVEKLKLNYDTWPIKFMVYEKVNFLLSTSTSRFLCFDTQYLICVPIEVKLVCFGTVTPAVRF